MIRSLIVGATLLLSANAQADNVELCRHDSPARVSICLCQMQVIDDLRSPNDAALRWMARGWLIEELSYHEIVELAGWSDDHIDEVIDETQLVVRHSVRRRELGECP